MRISFSGSEIQKNFSDLLKYAERKQYKIKEIYFSAHEINTSNSKAGLLLSLKNILDWESARNELNKFYNNINIEPGLGAVSLIGDGINRDNSILLSSIKLLEDNEIKIFGISTTSFRISFLLSDEYVKFSAKIFHQKWIEEIS